AVGADELVLLKSSSMHATSWQEAADAGFVDRYFPTAAAGVRSIRTFNLRDATMKPASPSAADERVHFERPLPTGKPWRAELIANGNNANRQDAALESDR